MEVAAVAEVDETQDLEPESLDLISLSLSLAAAMDGRRSCGVRENV